MISSNTAERYNEVCLIIRSSSVKCTLAVFCSSPSPLESTCVYFVVVIFFFSIFLASYSKIPERHFFDSSANQNCFYSLIFREIFTVSNDLNPSLFLFTTQKKNVIVVFSIFISKLLDQQRSLARQQHRSELFK